MSISSTIFNDSCISYGSLSNAKIFKKISNYIARFYQSYIYINQVLLSGALYINERQILKLRSKLFDGPIMLKMLKLIRSEYINALDSHMQGCKAGARYLLFLGVIAMLAYSMVYPAAASFLQNGFFLQVDSFGLDSSPVLCNLASPGIAVTELDNGTDVVVSQGTKITINLVETDPHQNWGLVNAVGADSLNNSLIVAYPLRHQFVLQAESSCVVLFMLIDEPSDKMIKYLKFNLIVAPPTSGIGWPEFSPDMAPAFGWPPQLKFSEDDRGELPLLSYEGFVL
jgi:hypothetical protein